MLDLMSGAARVATPTLPETPLDTAIHESQRLRDKIETLTERDWFWKAQQCIRRYRMQIEALYEADLSS